MKYLIQFLLLGLALPAVLLGFLSKLMFEGFSLGWVYCILLGDWLEGDEDED